MQISCNYFLYSGQQRIRVFSLVSSQWSKERNRLSEKTVKSLLQVRVNLDFSCSEMHEVISKDQKLLKQILSGEKYL